MAVPEVVLKLWRDYSTDISAGITMVTAGVDIGITVAKIFGWEESTDVQLKRINEELQNINNKLEIMDIKLQEISEKIDFLVKEYVKMEERKSIAAKVQAFDQLLEEFTFMYQKLKQDIEEQIYRILAGEGIEDEKAADKIGIPMQIRTVVREKKRTRKIYEIFALDSSFTDRQQEIVFFEAIRRVVKRLGNNVNQFAEKYNELCKLITGRTLAGTYDIMQSAVHYYDVCSCFPYNFDFPTWESRILYRLKIEMAVYWGCATVAIVETYKNYADEDTFDRCPQYYGSAVDEAKLFADSATKTLGELYIDPQKTTDSVYCYAINKEIEKLALEILLPPDIFISAAVASVDEAQTLVSQMVMPTMREEFSEAGINIPKEKKYMVLSFSNDEKHDSCITYVSLDEKNPQVLTRCGVIKMIQDMTPLLTPGLPVYPKVQRFVVENAVEYCVLISSN